MALKPYVFFLFSIIYKMENKDKWLIGIDLDGTTLTEWDGKHDEDGSPIDTIHPLTIEGIKLAQQAGHHVVIDTGRSLHQASNIYKQLGMNSLLINQAGSQINKPGDDSFKVVEHVISKEEIERILDDPRVKESICGFTYEVDHTSKVKEFKVTPHFAEYARNHWGSVDFDGKLEKGGSAMVMWFNLPKSEVLELQEYLKEKYPNESTFTQWGPQHLEDEYFGLEMNPIKYNKGTALLEVAELLGIPQSNTMAMGDAENDIPMLKVAAVPVVMSNGLDEVKALAKEITDLPNTEGGVGDFLIKYFNLK